MIRKLKIRNFPVVPTVGPAWGRYIRHIALYSLLGVLMLGLGACAASSEEVPRAPAEGEPGEEAAPGELPAAQTVTAPTPPALPTVEPEKPTTPPVFPEERLVTLEWPEGIRVGDSDVIRLSLVVDERGEITPTAYFEDHEIQAERVQIENLYDTHIIRAEARLDMLGLEVTPAGTTDRRLLPGEPADFSWTLSPASPGTYRGTIWLSVRYLPLGEGEPVEKVLFSRPLEIQGRNLLGLGGQAARLLGLLGTGVTSLFGLDDILTWLRRLRARRAGDA